MRQQEIVELFDTYLNEHGQFFHFKKWVEKQGYALSELGIEEE